MPVNKRKNPGWYRVVVWIILICFVVGFVGAGAVWIFNPAARNQGLGADSAGIPGSQETTSQAALTAINSQYQAQVDAKRAALTASPNDFNANSNLGMAYVSWAQALRNSGDAQAAADATARFRDAVPYLKKAYGLKSTDTEVANIYVLALAFSGDQAGATAQAREVTQKNPDNAEAWLALGSLLANSNEANAKADAIAALRTAIEKDTSGALKASAQQQIDTLNSAQ
ncbi:MAG: hypothetical protein FWC54_00955 [Actinomycetia bacterium]|nr:hypothetical protein [Actinomycetes bacterium]